MDPEVQIFGRMFRNECRQILEKNSLMFDLSFSQSEDKSDFILIRMEDVWCIFDSSQHSVMELARSKQYKTLTCGFSPYDTLVLSSSERGQALVSLQREIRTVSGQVVEPGDFLIQKSEEYSDMTLLLCTAVFLLLDRKQPVFEF